MQLSYLFDNLSSSLDLITKKNKTILHAVYLLQIKRNKLRNMPLLQQTYNESRKGCLLFFHND